jgi:hypothetical protein
MSDWLRFVIAVPCVLLLALGIWKASNPLTRRGVVVRPVDLMDETMTKIEKRFAYPNAVTPSKPGPRSRT